MKKYNIYLHMNNLIDNEIIKFYKIQNPSSDDTTKIIKFYYKYIFENIKKYKILDDENMNKLIKIFS